MSNAECCEQGRSLRHVVVGNDNWAGQSQTLEVEAKFCPFCGHDLSQPVYQTLEEAISSLANLRPQTICFDVDGVLCDNSGRFDSGSDRPYANRPPYPWAARVLGMLKAAGHTIHIQTARYMAKFHGDQQKAQQWGMYELTCWLREHRIPYDQAWMGKCSANIYVDDRGFRVVSNNGVKDWLALATHIASDSANRV